MYGVPFVHDDVIKWKHFRVTGHLCGEFTGLRWIPRTEASDAELWCFFDLCLNKWLRNNRQAGDLRRYRTHYDVIVMEFVVSSKFIFRPFIFNIALYSSAINRASIAQEREPCEWTRSQIYVYFSPITASLEIPQYNWDCHVDPRPQMDLPANL